MSYSLVIAEKPSAARRIANALADSKVSSKRKRGIFYYIFYRNGRKHIVVPAVGHLYKLSQRGKGWNYPVFDVEWVETYKVNRKLAYSKNYLMNIKELADADDYFVATDYDVEGRIIAYNILRFVCNTKKARSMNFSTLTDVDLIEAYENARDSLEWGMINSGITRHFLDYYYGVNLTRALTLALNKKVNRGFRILSAGRVQAPTLKILLDKEKQIRKFKPTPYWQIELHAEIHGNKVTALHVKDRFWDKTEARNTVQNCREGTPKVSVVQRLRYKQKPPTPFNLTDLQSEVYRIFGYAPDRTNDIAQSLYVKGWISYPRTSSQKLPEKIGYRRILKALTRIMEYHELSNELLNKKALKPRQGEKKDPAHAAIYPTHQPPKRRLKNEKGKLYDLICRRFLATFADLAVRETSKVTFQVNREAFHTEGRRTITRNWHRFYGPYAVFEEKELPAMIEGDQLERKTIKLLDKQTNPPPRYTFASLVRALEEKKLGTKATRAQIVRTLYDRGYLKGNRIEITKLGETVVQILGEYCPKIVNEELTREAEQKMNIVQQGKLEKEDLVRETKQVLTEILKIFKEREDEIGEKLADSFS